ncbi:MULTISPECIES: response regulator transcription factor [unclassified Salinibacterium]|uniref:response regulator transcription factor n=1 Tax=unclassified Salinibacterium TaxID=2632331 RepID=UPI001424820B|nr:MULTISPECIES: response regulator transcription factor [unclassified Salinibacterium]
MSIRVILADDHQVFLDGLTLLLETTDGVDVVGTARDGVQLLELAGRTEFDVAVVDLDMPELDGAAATAGLLQRWPDAAVLILTMHDDDASLLRALRSGASGYILKGAGHGSIVRAILGAAEGDTVFTGRAGRAVRDVMQNAPATVPHGLTAREFELLAHVASGADNSSIASSLFLSIKTVQNTVSMLMSKLGAGSRAHLVALARDMGVGG